MVAEPQTIETYEYERGVCDPDIEIWWRRTGRTLIPFLTSPHEFTIRVAKAGTPDTEVLTKTSGVVVSDTGPNVRIQWADGELDLIPGLYLVAVRAVDVATGRARNPIRFRVRITDPLG